MKFIQKGKVSSLAPDGKTASVTPCNGGIVTPFLTVPWFLIGVVPVNTEVVYVLFEDNTGSLLGRMDGEWNNGLQGTEGG